MQLAISRFDIPRLLAEFCLLVAVLCTAARADDISKPVIVLAPASIEVRGLRADVLAELRSLRRDDPRWPKIFKVSVVAGGEADETPMLGVQELAADAVRFRPRFPLERGVNYRAVFNWPVIEKASEIRPDAPGTGVRISRVLTIPVSHAGPAARVLAIYPSARELPENLLRLYVQFSQPMTQGNSYRRLHLHDDTTGVEVEQPLLELPQELWSPDGTRLTLLLEPGRVKHGLVPRQELGPILIAGRNYTLTVDASWPDAEGRPLREAFHKAFRAVHTDSAQPDPHSWKIETPRAGSLDPLTVHFPRPLDRAMLERVLRVLNLGPPRKELIGTVDVIGAETCWTFKPREPWSASRYVLSVSTNLEDPTGNSIGRPFEVDLNQSPRTPSAPAVVEIEFDVRDRR